MADDGLDKLARTLADTLPQSLRSMRDDLEKNFRAVLKSGLDRLELVTREEFEVQEAVLERTRQKLEMLEARLQKMESATTPARSSSKKKKSTKSATKKKRGKKAKKKS